MDKADIIKEVCSMLLQDRKDDCRAITREKYPFTGISNEKRRYSAIQQTKIFLRDGFVDRYTGEKLLFPGIFRILKLELPDVYPYHLNWKMTETHMVYWELFPTIDHIIPIARGGQDNETNWVTTSMMRNSAKSNWTLDEIGWTLSDPGSKNAWDGLTKLFLELTRAKQEMLSDPYVKKWQTALLTAL